MQRFPYAILPIFASLLALTSAGCGNTSAPAQENVQMPGGGIPIVSLIVPERKSQSRAVTQPATVEAYHTADIYAKVAGYLTTLKCDIGDRVEAGETLAVVSAPEMDKQVERQMAEVRKLEADERRSTSGVAVAKAAMLAAKADIRRADAEVSKAEASVAADQRELERTRELVERRSVSDRLLDEAQKRFDSSKAAQQAAEAAVGSAEAQLQMAESKVAAAEADLESAQAQTEVARKQLEESEAVRQYATLKSPFAGTITARNVDIGDLVRDAQSSPADRRPLFSVAQTDKVRVRVSVPERDAADVDIGDKASITLQARPGETLEGQVSRFSHVLDEGTRTMLVEIDFPNPEGKLLPGMFGQATIEVEPNRERIVLPANAVRFDETGNGFVYLVNSENKVETVQVQLGLDDGQLLEIVAGLNGDERVIGPSLRRFVHGELVAAK